MQVNNSSYINIHSHYQPKIKDEFVVRNAFTVLNKSQLEKLPYAVSVGLHPWYLHKMSTDECADYLVEVVALKNVLAIGEVGIDRAIETSIVMQQRYFDVQLTVAKALQKPIIIHAVRSYSDIIPYLKKSRVPFIFHQFNGNVQQAKELLKYDCRLSFGQSLFTPKGAEVLSTLPANTFLLETDTAAHLHIADVYNKAAEIRKIEVPELKEQLFYTFAQNFQQNG